MDWFVVSPLLVGLLFLIAMLAGFIDSIAGGGGLLTVPSLLAAGLSPAQALATNKLQSVGGLFSASLYFIRRGAVNLNEQWLNIAMTLLGSVLGAILIQRLQADFLRQMLPLFLIAIGLWFLLMPRLGEVDRARRLHGLAFALVGGGAVGFYDGFFGPGAGFFLCAGFRHALRLQPCQSDRPCQGPQFHLEPRQPAVLYVRRQSSVGNRPDHDARRFLRRASGRKTGAEPRTEADPPDGGDCVCRHEH